MTGERYVHAIFPNAVEQGRVVAANLLGDDLRYEGSESMNSLKHVGLPVIAVGAKAGDEELRWRDGGALRKVFVSDGRIVGFRLAGDIRGAGVYRALMLKRADVRPFGEGLIDPSFGAGTIALLAQRAVAV
jgi:NAD(P)H-nitrite reductase large subunit